MCCSVRQSSSTPPPLLPRKLRENPERVKIIRALARDLGRDYKRVHDDVSALEAVGLIERKDGTLRADYDEIRTSISLTPQAA